jgi:hypothetical protein
MDRNSVHDEIQATYTVFRNEDKVFLQIDTYGRDTRDMPGKKSQSLQLDRDGAKALYEILKTEFDFE